ncbi:hypothetical protein AALO_G00113140 [Alosa alosa]|uniref:Uncharacterized protein n=1 Tax=Alosa alosa TaxID=278164 RepID=A0AAV6GQK7_9TELE|nr:hypothetical protein AALO_G00113140 [Alosa alosa]
MVPVVSLSIAITPLWSGSPLFRKNGGVLLQVPQRVIQNGSRVSSQGVFPVIRPLHISPVGSRTSAMRSALGDFLTKGTGSLLSDSASTSDSDAQEDHTYSSAKSAQSPEHQGISPSSSSSSSSLESSRDDIIKVKVMDAGETVEVKQEVKQEPQDIPLDGGITSSSQQLQHQQAALRRRVLWVKGRQPRTPGDTLPLKKRRAAEKPPDSDDEEMKEAAGSLLHLAGVRSCLNNITNRTAKGQKEQKDKEAQRN